MSYDLNQLIAKAKRCSAKTAIIATMIYHQIALNVPLGLLTYMHPKPLPAGARVVVPFRGKSVVGIVWNSDITPDYDPAKILPVTTVFDDEEPFSEMWRQLLTFTARYYHYPIGQAVYAALPHGLKTPKTVSLPQAPLFYSLNQTGREQQAPPERYHKQHILWQALASGSHALGYLTSLNNQAPKLLAEWAERGWVNAQAAVTPILAPSLHTLNTEQNAASQQIQESLGQFQPFLLYGITGSGKTEVYFDVIAKVLAAGQQVLFLLPEINLTPQLLTRISERFAEVPTAVLHSQMAAGQRTQDYLRAKLLQAKLVIGTRLAVFTPLPNLGLIVVDEEHDGSFKQDNELRYQARDLAVWRAQQAACPIVLGSATPSLESWHKAHSDAYQLLSLSKRAHIVAQLPNIHILDVRRLPLENGFSPQALKLLQDNHVQGGMSLVYLNRRGFAPALFCSDCGHTFGCPRCSAKMVLHQRARQLRCHHCDWRVHVPKGCPECGNQDLTAVGQGTQRVEETLRKILPKAAVVRVDRDSTAHKNDWAELYQRISAQEIDVLVGTQMLAKGHDFARLNLVIVLNADGALYSADFRAPEHLFAELMQVSGRAGRAETPGQVLIQTQLPDHAVFSALKAQDFSAFATHELQERELFQMPPFGFQAAIRADAMNSADALQFLNDIKAVMEARLPEHVSQLGPAPMLMARLAERERAQLFIETTSRRDLHHVVSVWVQILQQYRDHKIRWSVDIDPQNM